jgi:hypothetical protein
MTSSTSSLLEIANYLIVKAANFMVIVIEASGRPFPDKRLPDVVFTQQLITMLYREIKFRLTRSLAESQKQSPIL